MTDVPDMSREAFMLALKKEYPNAEVHFLDDPISLDLETLHFDTCPRKLAYLTDSADAFRKKYSALERGVIAHRHIRLEQGLPEIEELLKERPAPHGHAMTSEEPVPEDILAWLRLTVRLALIDLPPMAGTDIYHDLAWPPTETL